VLRSDTLTDVTQTFTAQIIANTSLSAGGTSTLTITPAAPATTYNSYQIYGTAGGASYVGRRYSVTNAAIGASMANYFPYPVAYVNSDGSSATLTSTPAATVSLNGQQSGIGVAVDPTSGTILLARPAQLVFSADGITPEWPTNVQVFVPVDTGALSVTYPSSAGSSATATATISSGVVTHCTVVSGGTGYTSSPAVLFSAGGGSGAVATAAVSGGAVTGITVTSGGSGYTSAPTITLSAWGGTAYQELSLERTKTITVSDWVDSSNAANMLTMAYEYATSFQDIVYEGSIPYFGLLSAPLLVGHALNILGNGYSTGWESLNAPIIAVDLEYRERSGATSYVTTLTFSNRRAAFTGAALQRPAVVGQPLGIGGGVGTIGDTLGAVSGLQETAGQVDAGIGSQAGAVASSAAQSASAGLGDPVTALSSPQEGIGPGGIGAGGFAGILAQYQAAQGQGQEGGE
jgi:hypothetical protein